MEITLTFDEIRDALVFDRDHGRGLIPGRMFLGREIEDKPTRPRDPRDRVYLDAIRLADKVTVLMPDKSVVVVKDVDLGPQIIAPELRKIGLTARKLNI